MRISEFKKYSNYLNKFDMAKMFNVNVNKYGYALYNLNETLAVSNNTSNVIYKTYIPSENETSLLIAHKLYNNIKLYWIILKLNNIKDAFHIFTPNDVVKYLDYSYVDQIIKNI